MRKLSALLLIVLLSASCSLQEEPEIEVIEASPTETVDEEGLYPVILYDRVSALSLLQDCKAGMSSYMCDAVDMILDHTKDKYSFTFAIPKRPRHCPSLRCISKGEVWGTTTEGGSVPGTVCEPDICGQLLGDACMTELGGLTIGVRSADPRATSAFIYSDGEAIAGTSEEYGGRILDGFECNTVNLDFGVPLEELLEAGMEIRVNTVVNVDGEPVQTSFTGKF